jgi:hypothetical protein
LKGLTTAMIIFIATCSDAPLGDVAPA